MLYRLNAIATQFSIRAHSCARAGVALCAIAAFLTANQALGQTIADTELEALGDVAVEEVIADDPVEDLVTENDFGRIGSIGTVDTQTTSAIEDDPYAPQGIRLGSFTLRPSVEFGLTHSQTKSNSTGATSDFSSLQTNLELLVNSDWARHALNAEIIGAVPVALEGDPDEATVNGNIDLRLDLTSSTTLTLGVNGSLDNQTPSSQAYLQAIDPDLNPGVTGDGDASVTGYGASASLEQSFGLFNAQITGSVDRTEYDDALLSNGTSVSQSDLNATVYEVSLRGGFSATAALSPFVEVGYGQRITDDTLDSAGLDRSSEFYSLRVGTEIDLGEKLSGEVSVGYIEEEINDASLETLGGLTFAAALNWSPRRGTNVGFNASTETQSSGASDVSGSLVYNGTLSIDHQITPRWSANASLGLEYEDVTGNDADTTTYNGELGLVYNLNRTVGITGRVNREQSFSDDASDEETTHSAFIGLRLRR